MVRKANNILALYFLYKLIISETKCNLNTDQSSFTSEKKCDKDLTGGILNAQNDSSSADLPLIDVFLNKEKRKDLNATEKVMKDLMMANFPLQEIGRNLSSLFSLLWPSSLPCHSTAPGSEHLLRRCVLHGQEVNCTKLFKPVPTDLGICCAFNARNVLRDSEFSRLLQRKQSLDPAEEGEIHTVEVGQGMGLQVVVDQHSNRVTAESVAAMSRWRPGTRSGLMKRVTELCKFQCLHCTARIPGGHPDQQQQHQTCAGAGTQPARNTNLHQGYTNYIQTQE